MLLQVIGLLFLLVGANVSAHVRAMGCWRGIGAEYTCVLPLSDWLAHRFSPGGINVWNTRVCLGAIIESAGHASEKRRQLAHLT